MGTSAELTEQPMWHGINNYSITLLHLYLKPSILHDHVTHTHTHTFLVLLLLLSLAHMWNHELFYAKR